MNAMQNGASSLLGGPTHEHFVVSATVFRRVRLPVNAGNGKGAGKGKVRPRIGHKGPERGVDV
jgi:hypothetical protein